MSEESENTLRLSRQDQPPKQTVEKDAVPVGSRQGPLSFKALSLDLKQLILSFIYRPTDLKSLCLTCKEFREIATPILYRRIHFFVGGSQDLHLTPFLGRDNPGLQHIREVHLSLERVTLRDKGGDTYPDDHSDDRFEVDHNGPHRQANFTVRLLLEFLPANQLEVFSWRKEQFSVDNFLILCKKQQRIQRFELHPMDRPLLPELMKIPQVFDNMSEIKSLHLAVNSVDKLKVAQMLLQAKPNVDSLCVASGFHFSGEAVPEDLQDSSVRPGLMTRTMFSHLLPFERCTPLVLKKLDIRTVDLRYAADTWLKVTKLTTLEKLEICDCDGVDAFFAQLSKPHVRPAKLKFLRWMDDENAQAPAMEALEGLLEMTSGLEVLHVWVDEMDALPKVGAIIRHKKTLTSLGIHCQKNRDNVHSYTEDDYREICNQCTEIRQLSLAFPHSRSESEYFSPDFDTFLGHTLNLNRLVTLNVTQWPIDEKSFNSTFDEIIPIIRLYEHHLQRFSQLIFERSDADAKEQNYGRGHRSNLSVIAWGGNGKTKRSSNDNIRLRQIPFVRGTKVDPFGNSSLLAVQTKWESVQFVEPESDILTRSLYDLYWSFQGPGL